MKQMPRAFHSCNSSTLKKLCIRATKERYQNFHNEGFSMSKIITIYFARLFILISKRIRVYLHFHLRRDHPVSKTKSFAITNLDSFG